jgi:hypothetical protein
MAKARSLACGHLRMRDGVAARRLASPIVTDKTHRAARRPSVLTLRPSLGIFRAFARPEGEV